MGPAGSVQSVKIIGCGVGKPPKPGIKYWTYNAENIAEDLSGENEKEAVKKGIYNVCWGFGVPVPYGQGKEILNADWGKSGGGLGSEWEHLVQAVKQALMHCLPHGGNGNHKCSTITMLTNILTRILPASEKGNAPVIAENLCKLLRKQQVLGGLPSCALFNQLKCDFDLIKVKIVYFLEYDWFHVMLEPNEKVIRKLFEEEQDMLSDKGHAGSSHCNLYGIKSEKSAWRGDDTEEREARIQQIFDHETFRKGNPPMGYTSSISKCVKETEENAEDILEDMRKSTAALPDMLNKRGRKIPLAEVVIKRTRFVCDKYNEMVTLDAKYGPLLSGLCVASSILIGDASMLNLFKSQAQVTGSPATSANPQLNDLACLAIKFFREVTQKLESEGEDGETLNDLLNAVTMEPEDVADDTHVYRDFVKNLKNPFTEHYVKEGNGPPLPSGGGSKIKILHGGSGEAAAPAAAEAADPTPKREFCAMVGQCSGRFDFISHFDGAVHNVHQAFEDIMHAATESNPVGFDKERIAEAVFCAPSYEVLEGPICMTEEEAATGKLKDAHESERGEPDSFFLRDQQLALFMQHYCSVLEAASKGAAGLDIDEIPTIIAQIIKDLLSKKNGYPENIDPIKLIMAMGSEMQGEERAVFYDIAVIASAMRDLEDMELSKGTHNEEIKEMLEQSIQEDREWEDRLLLEAEEAALGPEAAGEQAPGDERSSGMSLELPEVELPEHHAMDEGDADIPVPPEEEQVRDDLGSPPQTQPDSPRSRRRKKKKKGRSPKPKKNRPRKRKPRSRTRNKPRRRKPRSRSRNKLQRKPRSKSKRKQPKKKSVKERLRKTLNRWLQ